jgi:Cd2+/Zn2+-exporting ATPase
MSLKFDADRTSSAVIEGKIRTLGFTPVGGGLPRTAAAGSKDGPRSSWWRGRKAYLALAIAVMFAFAFAVAHIEPALAQWAYSVAAVDVR